MVVSGGERADLESAAILGAMQDGQAKLDYRVAGVAVHDGHALLQRAEIDDFWALPGGRCEMMEFSRDALRREIQEEIGVNAACGRLLWVAALLFCYSGGTKHQLCLFFELSFPDDPWLLAKDVAVRSKDQSVKLETSWFPLASLAGVDLRPRFLRDGLLDLPGCPKHVWVNELQDR